MVSIPFLFHLYLIKNSTVVDCLKLLSKIKKYRRDDIALSKDYMRILRYNSHQSYFLGVFVV